MAIHAYVDGHVCSQHSYLYRAQVALSKVVHNALLINQLWFSLAFLEVLANFSTDKDELDCSLELET